MTTAAPPQPPAVRRVPQDPVEERRLAALAYVRGPSALIEEGYNGEAIQEFMQRAHVADAFSALAAEHKNEDILLGRVRFLAKREMARHVPDAVEIMRRALHGPEYAREPDGSVRLDNRGRPVMLVAGVADQQMAAATEILNRLAVGAKILDPVADNNPNALFTSQTEARRALMQQGDNLTPEQRTLGRERLRAVMQALAPQLSKIRSVVLAELPASDPVAKAAVGKVRPSRKVKPKAKR